MSVIADAISGMVKPVLDGANGLVKSVFGSKEQRDTAAHSEQMSVMAQYAAEFGPRQNRTRWDSFVDGANRLVRPSFTFGIIGMFVFCMVDPERFVLSMQALRLMPVEGWAAVGTVLAFWFGGKFVAQIADGKLQVPDPAVVREVLELYADYERREKEANPLITVTPEK